MLRTILVDDERPALNALSHLLKDYPEIEMAGTFTDINQALDFIGDDGNIQLVFLDIDMPKLNGIAAAKIIFARGGQIDIVFVTAYQQFAVEAFEVDATDYILKPVSPKRLDQTIERIVQKRLAPLGLAARRERADLLNQLIAGEPDDPAAILRRGQALGVNLALPFSFFVILPVVNESRIPRKQPTDLSLAVNGFLDRLAAESGLVAWPTGHGIGVLDFTLAPSSEDRPAEESARAVLLKARLDSMFPEITVVVGVAEPAFKIENFAGRYLQARNAAAIGMRVAPESGVHHFRDSGFLPVLDQYVNTQNVDTLIGNTIGKILEYDRRNSGELFRTMEKIVISNNLQEVAQSLFIHYKTVTFRKQTIERILGFAMNSFTGRTMLGVALTLYYLRNIPSIADPGFPAPHPVSPSYPGNEP
jgi:DNA-binding NarL/FixJ family response regulator